MSFLMDTLYPSGFKGSKFYFKSETREDGRRTIIHRYPNKGDDVEDIGKDSRVFNVSGVVTGFRFREDAADLEANLNDIGPGTFEHPELGDLYCVCRGFTRNFDLSKLGTIEFSMVFKEVFEAGFPVPSDDVITILAHLYNKFYEFAENTLKLGYIIDITNNIIAAAEKLGELIDQLKALGNLAMGQAANASDIAFTLKHLGNKTYETASSPTSMGQDLPASVGAFDLIAIDNPELRFKLNDQLFGFGADDIYSNLQTKSLANRNSNAKLMNGVTNALVLINSYDAAKGIVYKNDEQINQVETSLNEKYEILVNTDTNFISDELARKIDEIRVLGKQFFDQERLNVSKVIEITTNEIPLAVLTYKYYGSTDNWEDLLTLNSIYNPGRIDGKIKIFEE